MQTNLTPNFSFSTDYYSMSVKTEAHRMGKRGGLSPLSSVEVLTTERRPQPSDPIFSLQWTSELTGPTGSPLTEKSVYWLQMPPSKEFEKMTHYSGKFLIPLDLDKVERLWVRFCEAHSSDLLGYGLRCSTLKKEDKQSIVAIHIVNCFDLENVARVAYQIKQVLGDYNGIMQVWTDLSTELSLIDAAHPLCKNTYEIHDYVFRHYNGVSKEMNMFIRLFKTYEVYNRDRKKAEFDHYLSEQNK